MNYYPQIVIYFWQSFCRHLFICLFEHLILIKTDFVGSVTLVLWKCDVKEFIFRKKRGLKTLKTLKIIWTTHDHSFLSQMYRENIPDILQGK